MNADFKELRDLASAAVKPRAVTADVPEPPAYLSEGPPDESAPELTGEKVKGASAPPPAAADRVQPLEIATVATWAGRPAPQPRDWVIDGLIPAARVTSFLGNGGLGKSIIAGQIGVHVALGRPLFGFPVTGGVVLGIFCEDERDEIERRIRAACDGEKLDLAQLTRLYPCSRDGMDNLLCTFDHDQVVFTPFYYQLDATIAALRPRLLILDVLADLFAGDYLNTGHARQFIKVALGGWCVRYECAVLLIAHPSASGMASGDGAGFSTAWNNSVRSRLYLRQPKTEDPEEAKDRRILEVRKSNYAAGGTLIPLMYQRGYFVPDQAPLQEATKLVRPAKADTKLAVATMEYMRQQGAGGNVVVRFAALYEHLQSTGALPRGVYQTIRKQLSRTLTQLEKSDLIQQTKVPAGYRLVQEHL